MQSSHYNLLKCYQKPETLSLTSIQYSVWHSLKACCSLEMNEVRYLSWIEVKFEQFVTTACKKTPKQTKKHLAVPSEFISLDVTGELFQQ